MRTLVIIISIISVLPTVSNIRGKLTPNDAQSGSVISLSNTSNVAIEYHKITWQERTVASKSDGIYNFYFGNLHSHTSYSDGVGTPAHAFAFARDTAGIDFLAVTDHSGVDTSWGLSEGEFADIITQANAYTQDDVFIAIAGQEWTCPDTIAEGKNHINVLEADHIFTAPLNDFDSFYSELLTSGSIAIFNHPRDFSLNNFAYSPIGDNGIKAVEVRTDEEQVKYIKMLNNGWHVGADGSQDNHTATWGDVRCWTAVLAPSLTKTYILDAVRNHRTYSTIDRNLELTFKAEGHWMGESFSHLDNILFEISVNDPDAGDVLGKIELYQNGTPINAATVDGVSYTWTPVITPPNGKNYYFIKINPPDSQKAWSSPIWIDCSTNLPSTPVLFSPIDNTMLTTLTPAFVWDLSDNADNYTLQYSSSQDFPQDPSTVTVDNISGTYYTPTNDLLDQTFYYWRLCAVNGSGNSSYSEVRKFYVSQDSLVSRAEVSSSRLMVPFENDGTLGTPGMRWLHPLYGYVYPGYNGSFVLGTEADNLALDFGQYGLKFVPVNGWKQDYLYFDRKVPGSDPLRYTFVRNYSCFEHPTLPLQVEVFATGVIDPEGGPCADAIFVKYVIYNKSDEVVQNIADALHIDLDIFSPRGNSVAGIPGILTLWIYNPSEVNILMGMTPEPIYEGDKSYGGWGVNWVREIWPQSGWIIEHLWEILEWNPWDMNPYYDQPTYVGMMLTDYPFTLAPHERYRNEYIIWAYDKTNPVNGLNFGRFLYRLMQSEGYFRGNVNSDDNLNIADVIYMVNYLFKNGPGLFPLDDQGDVNSDNKTSVSDAIYLINYLFKTGVPPIDKNRLLPSRHITPQGDTLNYQEMFKRSGLLDDPLWKELPNLVP
jgi:hypothetical protein